VAALAEVGHEDLAHRLFILDDEYPHPCVQPSTKIGNIAVFLIL